MKKFTVTVLLTLGVMLAFAVGRYPIEVPTPKHTTADAIKMVQAKWNASFPSDEMFLVSVQWCRSDQFEGPRWFYGGTWPGGDREWAWFATCAEKRDKSGMYGRAIHFRVRDSGEVQVSIPPRI